ncbi:MAG TPA: hypothetical protein DIT13_14945 [Verrucomicrobiales bacterium]|nr:hypothetical protein [Verrucomicrobiales bacterium]HRJ09681.1 hypothetical protein [Prosthecobacter sp.]HRK16030.1 hypothetical protein [Prosthecobacter sp.]
MEAAALPTSEEVIVCRVTRWYFRRMGILAGMLFLMGMYFLYDGKYGYPAANKVAEEKEWFEQVLLKSYDEAKAAGAEEAWAAGAAAKGWPTGKNGEPPRWISHAAAKGWPEKPHKYTDREIAEQFWWGGGTLCAALAVAVVLLLNRKKTLRAETEHWTTPEGVTVRYADVFRVDKRPWDQKGLAYAWHKDAAGREKRAVIDDLKYQGAARVLDRILAGFKGELIEKIPDPPDDAETTPPQA